MPAGGTRPGSGAAPTTSPSRDEATGRYLGSCGLCPVEREHATAGLGFWVRTSDTGRGVATAAARLVADAGFEHLGLNRIELLIAVDNAASRRVAEKLGAAYEGRCASAWCSRPGPPTWRCTPWCGEAAGILGVVGAPWGGVTRCHLR